LTKITKGYKILLCNKKREIFMADNEKKEQLSKEIDQLTEENQLYLLGITQALSFAQESLNRSEDTSLFGEGQVEGIRL
jgi:hypothetical protein